MDRVGVRAYGAEVACTRDHVWSCTKESSDTDQSRRKNLKYRAHERAPEIAFSVKSDRPIFKYSVLQAARHKRRMTKRLEHAINHVRNVNGPRIEICRA